MESNDGGKDEGFSMWGVERFARGRKSEAGISALSHSA